MKVPNECRLVAAEAYSKATADGASLETALWRALDAVAPLIAAQGWDEGESAGRGNYGRVVRKETNPYRSQA